MGFLLGIRKQKAPMLLHCISFAFQRECFSFPVHKVGPELDLSCSS